MCVCVIALQLVEPPKPSLTLQAGDNITFVCIGDNAAVIAWYQSNRVVTLTSDGGGVILKFDRDYDSNRQTALLTRTHVVGEATGDYQCRDQNNHIGHSRIIRLQVVAPAAELSVNNSTWACIRHPQRRYGRGGSRKGGKGPLNSGLSENCQKNLF